MKETKETKKDNYWGYIIFAALVLLYIPFGDTIWDKLITPTTKSSGRTMHTTNPQTTLTNNNQQNNSNDTANYCTMSSSETYDYLINTRSFTLNGHGTVRFSKRFDHARDKWIEDKINISSGTYRLEGTWKVIRGNVVSISNYKVVNGHFDASNNSPASGMLKIQCSGDLYGVLKDRNGNSIDINIKK
ncbi:hypothetical protein [Mesoflavibacter zeaxanthinifaciens]|uniref:hypothetical protein n=1 Tax=Mesoflavibacter zeaxanthinifaciens TaxID=393060 RepID=UPI003A8D12DC